MIPDQFLCVRSLRGYLFSFRCLLISVIALLGISLNVQAQTESFSVKIEGESYTSMYGIQTEATTDIGGGSNVGYINNNDWMSYGGVVVDIPRSGAYKITYRVASASNSGVLQLRDANTNAQIDRQLIPKTGGWQTWKSIEKIVNLNEGIQAFTIYAEVGNFNFNWFKIESVDHFPESVSAQIDAENYTTMYGIKIESTTDDSSGFSVGYIDNNDWISYGSNLVLIPRTETYKVTYRVASLNGGGIIQLRDVNTGAQIDRVLVPKTNGWQTWQSVESIINLNQGVQGFTIHAEVGKFNFNWFKIESIPQSSGASSFAHSISSNVSSFLALSSVTSSISSSLSSATSSSALSSSVVSSSSVSSAVVSPSVASNAASTPSLSTPTVNLISPADLNGTGGEKYYVGESFTRYINASASDSDGSVVKIDYYINDVFYISSSGSASIVFWNPSDPGIYSVYVIATDNSGLTTKSVTRNFYITPANGSPLAVLKTPASTSDVCEVGKPFTIGGLVYSGTANVTKVEFKANGQVVGTDLNLTTDPNRTFSWTPASAGVYPIIMSAYDQSGRVSHTSSVSVTCSSVNTSSSIASSSVASSSAAISSAPLSSVQSSSAPASSSVSSIDPATLPKIELIIPEAGGVDNYPLNQKAFLSARLVNAAGAQWKDAGGVVPKVSFYIDGYEKIGEVIGDGAKLEWTPPAQGVYVIHAEIVLSGYKVKSRTGALNIVQPAGHPTVRLSNIHKDGQTHNLGSQISIAAYASDDSTITKVGFYANNVLITEVPTTPNAYVYHDWLPSTPGSYKLVARAYDNSGNVSISKAVELFFVNPATQSSSSSSSSSVAAVTIGAPLTPIEYFDLGSQVWMSGQVRTATGQYRYSNSSIPSIDFFANETQVYSGARGDGDAVSWQPAAVGAYEIYSTARLENNEVIKSPTAIAVVKKNGAPRVYLTSPQINNLLLPAGETLTLAADAVDSDGGTIRALTFYVDIYDASGLNKIGSTSYPKNSAPYSINVGPFAADAVFKVYVLAEDNSGLQSVSSTKVIRYTGVAVNSSSSSSVASELEVELASPHQGAVDNYASGQVVPLSARLFNTSGLLHKDTDGSFPKVTFIADDYETLGQSTADGSLVNWIPPVPGIYTIKAIAELKNGTKFVSKVGSVNVAGPAGYPSVSFMSGVIRNGMRFLTTNSGIGLAVNSSDNGSVAKVVFYANNQLLKEVLASSGAFVYQDWKPTVAGSYQLKAVAFDNSGNSATSRTVEIFVDEPSVSSSSSTSSSGSATAMRTWLDLGSPNRRTTEYYTLGSGNPYPFYATAKLEINGVSQVIYNLNGSKIQSDFYSNGAKLSTVNPQPVHTMQNWMPSSAGTYEITAQAPLENGDRLVSDTGVLVVSQTGAPRVNLSSPQNSKQIYYSGTAISLSASANDSDGGTISRVDFSINGTVISDTSAPYTVSHFLGSPGNYDVFATAYDNAGLSQKSVVRTINVSPVPRNSSSSSSSVASNLEIELTAPLQGMVDNYQSGQSVALSARLFDASGVLYKNPEDGSIVNVSFIADDYDVLLQTGNGFNSTWVPPVPGIYTIKAIAQLKNGTKFTSKVGSVNVFPVAGYPSVSFMNGVLRNGMRFLTTNSGIGLAVNASDDGSVTKVAYYANNQLITEVLASSGAFVYQDWKPTVAGSYKLKAVAFDNSGNSTTSRTVEIFVDAPGASSSSTGSSSSVATMKTWLDLGSPNRRTTEYYNLGSSNPYPFDATAKLEINGVNQILYNGNGTKIQSEFYGNGVKLPTVNPQPVHTMQNWTPPSAGTYEITAQAQLENGDRLVSDTGVLVVSQKGAPRVSLTSPENSKQIYYSGAEILLAASASDSDGGSITKVEFSLNGTVITDTTAPYTASYRAGAPGTYEVFVKAYDNSALTQQTGVRTINVVALPNNASSASSSSAGVNATFELTVPQQDTVVNYKSGEIVYLASVLSGINGAVFKDTNGQPAKVTFIADNYEVLVTGSTADGNYIGWTPSVPGIYTIKAVAELLDGTKFTSRPSAINVAAPTGHPVINFDGLPLRNGLRYVTNSSVYLSAYAKDDGSLTKVAFYINGQLIKEFTPAAGTAEFVASTSDWKPVAAAKYKFKAVATDNNGNSTTSRSLEFVVEAPGAHSSSSAPALKSWLDFTSHHPLKPNYFDKASSYPWSFLAVAKLDVAATGTIEELFNGNGSKVASEFYRNGVKLQTTKYEPANNMMHAWTPPAVGTYEVTAQAQLENGDRLVSDYGTVVVYQKGAPRVSFASPAFFGERMVADWFGPFVNVADSDGGSIVKVSFYLSDVNQPLDETRPPVYVATTSPYQHWIGGSVSGYGKYQIKAVAEDNSGLKTSTAIREFILDPSTPITSTSSSRSSSSLAGSNSSSSLVSNSLSSSSVLGVGSTSSLSSLSSRSSSLISTSASSSLLATTSSSSWSSSSQSSSMPSISSSSTPNLRMVAAGPYSGSGECVIDGNNMTCTGAAANNAPAAGSLVNPQWVSLSDTYACVLHKPGAQNVLLCWSGSKPLHQVSNLLDPITVAVTNEFGCAQRNPQEAYCWNQYDYDAVGNTVTPQYQNPALVTDRLCWVNTSRVLECVPNILAPDNGVEGEVLPFTPIGLSVGGELEMFPYACAISDKRLVCKGDPFGISFSALIDYTISAGSAYSFKQVSTGYNQVCTLQQTSLGQSKVECWDASGTLKTDTPTTLVKPVQVSAGVNRTCVIDEGQKKCW